MYISKITSELKNKSILNLSLLLCVILVVPLYASGPFLPDLFLSIAVIIFLIISLKEKLKKFYLNGYSKFFAILFVYMIFRSFFSLNPEVSLQSSLFYFRFYVFSLAVWYLISTEPNFKKFLFIILSLTLIFVLLDTLYQYLFGFDFFGFESKTHRLSGPFDDELIVGSFIVKILPVLYSINFLCFTKISKKMIYLFILSIFIVFLSGERTSFFIVCFFSLFFFIFISINNKKIIILLSIILTAASILAVLIFDKTRFDRMVKYPICAMNLVKIDSLECERNENTYGKYVGDKGRMVIFSEAHEGHYKSAIKMFLDSPIFGQGIKMYRYLCGDERFVNLNSCTTHPHNTLLQILAELGLIGFIFLLFVIFKIYQTLFKLIFSKKIIIQNNEKISFIFITVAIIQTFLIFLPSGQFFNNYLSILYYFPLGIFLNFHYNHFNGK